MSTSYAIHENHNFQSVLWSLASALFALVRFVQSLRFGWLWSLLALVAPDALLWGKGLATAALWCSGIAAIVGVLMLLATVPHLVACGVLIGVYAVVFKPR